MGLPAQIQRQVEQAEELQRQITQPPAVESAPAPAAAAANEPTQSATPAPAPAPTAPAPQETQQAQTPAELAALEQKYRTLQGMWGSTNARLQQATAQIADLTQKLADATAKLEKAAQPATEPQQKLVTEKDAEQFGSDLIDMVRRTTREEFAERERGYITKIGELTEKLNAQQQTLGTVAQSQAAANQQGFYATLDGGLPQWEQIQSTPECQQWLSSRVPGTPYTWNQALQDAAQAFDGPRALEVFDTFLKMHPQMDPRAKQPEAPKVKPELEKQIAPARTGSATAQQGTSKPTITAAEYSARMNEVMRLNKSRLYDRARELEQELNSALAEGRVTP